jgi:hypothetical protein
MAEQGTHKPLVGGSNPPLAMSRRKVPCALCAGHFPIAGNGSALHVLTGTS